MRISNSIKTAALSIMISGFSACERKPFKELPKKYVPELVQTKIDSLSKTSQRVLKDTTYKCFGKDTLLFCKKSEPDCDMFVKEMNEHAKRKSGKSAVNSYTVLVPMYNGKRTMWIPQVRHDYEYNYLKQQTVIRDTKLFTTDSTDIYVPVEYYGIPNPKLNKKK